MRAPCWALSSTCHPHGQQLGKLRHNIETDIPLPIRAKRSDLTSSQEKKETYCESTMHCTVYHFKYQCIEGPKWHNSYIEDLTEVSEQIWLLKLWDDFFHKTENLINQFWTSSLTPLVQNYFSSAEYFIFPNYCIFCNLLYYCLIYPLIW